ncbi:acyltransferase family protein [Rheinheimera texasensis]|uniref:acyltransferase family protein n=1 Tax=Rheinheimera texasensis TaxID=306205 RepID=UPI0032B16103
MTQPNQSRRADLDWLRIGAFALLILYHCGMYYVADWGWHVKNSQTYDWLQDLMKLTNPWRMSLLFLLGGMALAIARPKFSGLTLLRLRCSRLLIPLLFGMFVVVVPQVYFEALSQQLIEPGYLQFWWQYINPNTDLLREHHSPIGLLTWNHLWFLPYLFCYSLLLLPLHGLLQRLATVTTRLPLWLFGAVLVALHLWAVLSLREAFPTTHALVDDWYNHAKYGLVFVAGYLLVLQKHWWAVLPRWRYGFLVTALLGYVLVVLDNHDVFDGLDDTAIALQLLYSLVSVLNHWAWLGAALAFAAHYLQQPAFDPDGSMRRYASAAILPWYVLHQTLTVVFAVALQPLQLHDGVEAVLLISLTVLGCGVGYEIIRRVLLLNWLAGGASVTRQQRSSSASQPATTAS